MTERNGIFYDYHCMIADIYSLILYQAKIAISPRDHFKQELCVVWNVANIATTVGDVDGDDYNMAIIALSVL